jgi:hypothetical protein
MTAEEKRRMLMRGAVAIWRRCEVAVIQCWMWAAESL